MDALCLLRARRLSADGTGRRLRRLAGLSLAEVGAAVDASPSAVARWETGQRRPHGARGIAYGRLLTDLADELAS